MLSVPPRCRRSFRAALFAAGFAVPSIAIAQTAPTPAPAPTATPTRPQVELPRPEPERAPSRVTVEDRGALRAAPCPFEDSPLQVEISRVTFTGVGEALEPEITDLLAGIAPPAGGPQPVSVVCRIRDEANSRLDRAGYVASVQIPPQQIETGELQLQVVTARIVDVRVRGDARPYRDTIAARVRQLQELKPFNRREAEQILLIAGDIPGLDVQLSLSPAGTGPGAVIGELSVVYRKFSLLANAQNYGSNQLGRETAYVRGELFGLTGLSDVTYVGASTTLEFDEQQVVQFGHRTGIGNRGLALEGSILYAWSSPELDQLDLRSRTLIGSLQLEAPLVRTRRRTARIGTGLEIIDQTTRVFADGEGQPLNRDKLRVAFLRAQAEQRVPRVGGGDIAAISGYIELRKGLDILDATKRGQVDEDDFFPSRFEGDPTAFVVRGEIESEVAIGSIFSLGLSAFGQWTDDPLLNFEEFSLGNLTYGRGYDPGANSADRAFAVRAEARAKVLETDIGRFELFGFYDSVHIWNLDENATETDRRLDSYGGGVRALIRPRAFVEAMYARPDDRALLIPNARRAPDRFLLSVTVQFGPGGR